MASLSVFFFLLLTLCVGINAGRKSRTFQSYALARGSFHSFSLICTIVATFVGGGVVVGTAEKVFTSGIGYVVGLFGFSVQLLLIGTIIAPRIDRYRGALTLGDILYTAYGRLGQVVQGLLFVSLCVGIIIAQITAMGHILGLFLPFENHWNIFIGASIVMSYCYFGGIRSVVATDVLQMITLAISIPLVVFLGIQYLGGWSEFVAAIPQPHLSATSHLSVFELVAIFFSFTLGDALTPPMMQRLLMAKHGKQSSQTMIISGFCTIPIIILSGMLGLIALVVEPNMSASQVIPFLLQKTLSPVFMGLAISGLLAVIMSSVDSCLNCAAVALTHDIFGPLFSKSLNEQKQFILVRVATLVIGLVALCFSLFVTNAYDMLLIAYKFWGPTIVIPAAGLILGFRIPTWGFVTCCTVGAVAVVAWDYAGVGISGLVPAIFLNFATFLTIWAGVSISAIGREESSECKPVPQ